MTWPVRRWTPYVALALGLAATALATYGFARTARQRDETRFHNVVTAVHGRLRSRIDTYVAMLLGAKGLFAASDEVTAEQFRRYVDSLEMRDRYPGAQGIGFSLKVSTEDRARVEAERAVQGQPKFRIWPAYPRAEYHTILFLEPLDRRNSAAIGFDMFSEPVRREAMERARDTGLPAASGRVTLVQEIEPEKQLGFLIYVPVFHGGTPPPTVPERRRRLWGFVYCPFRVGDFLAAALGGETAPGVSVEVMDRGMPTRDAVFYRSEPINPAAHPRFLTTVLVPVAGRIWEVTLRAGPGFELFSDWPHTLQLAAVGSLISIMLSLIVGLQVKARSQAEASRRSAQTEREHLHGLFMQAPALIGIQRGPDHILEFLNLVARKLLGERSIGKPFLEGFVEASAAQMALLDRVYKTGERFTGMDVPMMVDWRGDGTRVERFFTFVHEPMRDADGQVEGIMSFAFDVTDQVMARKRMEALAGDLRKAVRVRDDFLSIAGHELKTPLAALQLQVQGLERHIERGIFGAVQPALLDRLRKVGGHVDRLERLIGELLDVSRITSGRLTLDAEELDLAALVREICERFSEQTARSGSTLALEADVPLVGRWDRLRLDQVVSNLVSNAIKYGEGRPIVVKVEPTSDERVRVVVRDHGIGIAPEDQARIFDRFERAVSDRNYGGLGLGLWISRQIVDAFGGTLSVESTPATGSAFTLDLPRQPARPLAN
jgi:signal transduction histidine kinase/CHASE1-domain containing sensor protein